MEEASLENLFLVCQFAIFIIFFQFLFTLTTGVLYAFIIPKYFVFGADRNEVCLVSQCRVQTWRRGWRAGGLMIEMHHPPRTKKAASSKGHLFNLKMQSPLRLPRIFVKTQTKDRFSHALFSQKCCLSTVIVAVFV